jgi:hypothetical protein
MSGTVNANTDDSATVTATTSGGTSSEDTERALYTVKSGDVKIGNLSFLPAMVRALLNDPSTRLAADAGPKSLPRLRLDSILNHRRHDRVAVLVGV